MTVEKKIADYIIRNRIQLSDVAKATGLDYKKLYTSLLDKKRKRELRAWEYLKLCEFLKQDFRETK